VTDDRLWTRDSRLDVASTKSSLAPKSWAPDWPWLALGPRVSLAVGSGHYEGYRVVPARVADRGDWNDKRTLLGCQLARSCLAVALLPAGGREAGS
jgi:hypothetical protein